MTDKPISPGTSEKVHGASEDVLADPSEAITESDIEKANPPNHGSPETDLMNDLVSHLCQRNRGFHPHFHDTDIDLSLPRPLPEVSLLTPEEAMLSDALQIDPEITLDEQAQLVSFYISRHGDPLNNANDNLFIQSVIDKAHEDHFS